MYTINHTITRWIGLCLLASLLLAIPSHAKAGDLRASLGIGGAGTEWRGDGVACTQLKLGYRHWGFLGVFTDINLDYAAVDQRFITLISLGIQAWGKIGKFRPFGRLLILHQHEESLSVIAGDFIKAILGVGDGIRHRGGIGFAVGTEYEFLKKGKWVFFLSGEAFLKWFPGDMGPVMYAGGRLAIGFNYGI
ncbi:MAG: hypothetical protein CL920_29240 [Deltaproteobacteria bacterium]|nr:hypothetical protein [Deltaproteobacteria bacterium]